MSSDNDNANLPMTTDLAGESAARLGNVAVSGANGFIARRFVELYGARFEGVAALVRSFPIDPVRGAEYRVCDVGQPHSVRFAVRGCDYFLHFAYDARNRQTAVAAADNVVAACRAEDVRRLVHLSTVAVYDQTGDGRLDESTRPAPYRDPYIESKIRIERALAARWRAGYTRTVIVQPTIVYGWPGSWSGHAITGCRSERVELPLAGEGRCSAVYVDDVCQAVFKALTTEIDASAAAPPRYLVSGPDDVTWRQLFEAHGEALENAGIGSRLDIQAPPTERRFADDAKVNLAMSAAFSPPAARLLYTALGLRKPKRYAAGGGHDDLAVLREGAVEGVQRFNGMGRLYTATRYATDLSRAANDLGYAPEFDLARGTRRISAALSEQATRIEAPRAPGMSIDLDGETPPTTIRRRVCVIGTGIGGGALAATLLAQGDDLVVVEAGDDGADDDETVGLENTGLDFDLAIYRDISVGGSGNAWRGLCSPRDRIDFAQRDWIPESGWPIGLDDLDEHNRAAAALLGIDDCGFFYDQSTIDGAAARENDIQVDRTEFALKHFLQTRPPWSARSTLLSAGDRPGGPLLLRNAPALELITDAAGTRIEKLLVKDKNGATHDVEADVFVVCAGALESPRLLLNSRQGDRAGIGNQHDLVGRYLMDHPMVGMGQVRLRPARTAPLYQALQLSAHRMIKAGVIMDDGAQQRHRLPNHSVFFLPSLHRGFDDNYERARRTLITARRKRLSPKDVFTVATNPNVIQWAISYVAPVPALFRYADLFFIAEQTPTAASRVDLSEQKDRYGYPMARAHWAVSDADVDSIVRFNDLLLGSFPADGYQVSYRREPDRVADAFTSAAHFCGTVRMGNDPNHSVVDADLKVWGVDNLYVCDASAFPTSGNANPGLTIAALAMRLARHLGKSR